MLDAALFGFGVAYVPEDVAQPHLAKGRLKRVLEDWCPPYAGYRAGPGNLHRRISGVSA